MVHGVLCFGASMPGAWVVAITRGQCERIAADEIERQQIECFLPVIKKTSRRSGRVIRQLRPLFPNYLFAFIHDNWRALLTTRGIVGLVMAADRPAILHDTLLKQIKSRCDTRGVYIPALREPYRRGELVRATGGAFQGVAGIYEGMSDDDRVRVLFNLMGRMVRVSLERGSLQAA